MATQTLLQLKSRFYQVLGTRKTVTATGGSTGKFTVAGLAELEPDCYKGWQLRLLTGTAAGTAANQLRRIGAGPNASGDLEVRRAFSAAIANGDTGELWGNSIDGGDDLTNLFNEVLKRAKPKEEVELPIVDRQYVYDVTSYLESPEDLIWVYVHQLDSAAERPYEPEPVRWCQARARTVGSAYKVELELDRSLTETSPASQDLYLWYYKRLTAFTADTSTVDATYADWLAHEAALAHAVEMAEGQADKGLWRDKASRLAGAVLGYRARFAPYLPRPQRNGRPL